MSCAAVFASFLLISSFFAGLPSRGPLIWILYLFNGWEPAVSRVTGDAVYTVQYSKYERQYEVTFVNYDGTVLQSSSVKYGEMPVYSGETPVNPPEAGRSYLFAGWTPEIVKVTGPALYTAVFVPSVTLTFRDPLPDGASGIPDPITVNPSMSRDVRIPDIIPQKSGRIFTGWNTAEDGSGTPYDPGSVITLVEDTTLWAQWELAGNSWMVVYNANGGTKAPRPQIVPQGQDAVLTEELPEAGRMVFRGWATKPDAPAAEYQPGDTALPWLWGSLILLGIIGLGFTGRTAWLKRRK